MVQNKSDSTKPLTMVSYASIEGDRLEESIEKGEVKAIKMLEVETSSKKAKVQSDTSTLTEFFSLATPFDFLMMFLGVIGSCGTGVSIPIFNVLFGSMLDKLNETGSNFEGVIAQLALTFVYIGIANLVTGYMQVTCWTIAGERQTQKYRELYVKSILSQEIGWFDECGASTLATRVADLSGKIEDGLGRKTGDMLQYIVQTVSAFIIALYFSWSLTLVLLCSLPLIAISGAYMINAITAAQNQGMEQYSAAGGLATESLSSIRTVTALNAQPDIINQYRKYLFYAMKIGITKGFKIGLGNGGVFGACFLTYALGFWYGGKLIADSLENGCSNDCVTGGTILSVFFCVIMGSMGMGQIAAPLSSFVAAKAASKPILDIIRRKPLIDGLSDIGLKPVNKPTGKIVIEQVVFAYPSRPNVNVCKRYDLIIESGETVAIVGQSGSGKSTVINLLLRFYDPQKGRIVMDGIDIKDLNVRWLRANIGYVGQEPVLFSGTIAENIAYGLDPTLYEEVRILRDPLSTDEEKHTARQVLQVRVEEAAKQANAHDFIMKFPQKYETDVGSSGSSMSGGQKQRIAIARALIKKPAVLLLDEATSALDAASERLVQESIDKLQQSKMQTTIVIAHRLSTIRTADKIAVISDGLIAELGSHDVLIARDGLYADLVRLQVSAMAPIDNDAAAVGEEEEEVGVEMEGEGNDNNSMNNSSDNLVSKNNSTTTLPEADVVHQPLAVATLSEIVDELGTGGVSGGAHSLVNTHNKLSSSSSPPHSPTTVSKHHHDENKKNSKGSKKDNNNNKLTDKESSSSTDMTKEESKQVNKQIWALVSRYSQWLTMAVIGAALFGAIFPVWGLLLARTQNVFYYSDPQMLRDRVSFLAGMFCIMAIVALCSSVVQFYGMFQMSERITMTLRSDVFEAILRREIAFFDKEENAVGALTTRLADDSRLVSKTSGESTARQIQAFFTLIVGLALALWASWKIALVVLATFPVAIAASAVQMQAIAGQNYDTEGMGGGQGGVISTAFTHMRTVAAFSVQFKVAEDYGSSTRQLRDIKISRSYVAGIGFGFAQASNFFTYALLFWYGSTLVASGEIEFVDLMTAILTLMLGALGLGMALNDLGDQKVGLKAAQRIFKLVEEGKRCVIDGLSQNGIRPAGNPTAAITNTFADNTTALISSSGHAQGRIELKNIHFAYPSRPEAAVCRNYNLVIESGEVVALVGPSGSGKSTIMNLLLRFYDPSSGQVLLDGMDIKELNVRWLRSQIGYVGQEPALFQGSVGENVAKGRGEYGDAVLLSLDEAMSLADAETAAASKGKSIMSSCLSIFSSSTPVIIPKAHIHSTEGDDALMMKKDGQIAHSTAAVVDDVEINRDDGKVSIAMSGSDSSSGMNIGAAEDVIEACKDSNAHEFIMTFPEKYHTDVGEGSIMVSGGQKQRIAIARALIKKPAVLLLDEATSALDAASERLVQESIDKLQQFKMQTTIVIAHRLTTIKNADKIVVIDKGEVVEIGTHEQLLDKQGLYATLWYKQTGNNSDGTAESNNNITSTSNKLSRNASLNELNSNNKLTNPQQQQQGEVLLESSSAQHQSDNYETKERQE